MALPLLRLLPSLPTSQPHYHPKPSSHLQFPLPVSTSSRRCPSSFAASLSTSPAPVPEPAPAPEPDAAATVPSKRLIAQNIPWDCTADDMRALFEKHGTVVDVELSMYNSSKNRGLAFISMGSEEEALAALNNLNSTILNGRKIKVQFSRSVKKQPVVPPAPTPKYDVFVGNLTWTVRSRDLRELFGSSPGFLSAEIIFQTNPRRSAGYGFVSFSSKEAAEAAISSFNGKDLMGRPIRVLTKGNHENAKKEPSVAKEDGLEVVFSEQSND